MLARVADRARAPVSAATAPELAQLDTIIAANIHAANERVGGRHDLATTNTLALVDALRTQAQPSDTTAATLIAATHLLERLDRTIARLAREEGTVVETVTPVVPTATATAQAPASPNARAKRSR
jgi:hypothetical protein